MLYRGMVWYGMEWKEWDGMRWDGLVALEERFRAIWYFKNAYTGNKCEQEKVVSLLRNQNSLDVFFSVRLFCYFCLFFATLLSFVRV